MRKVNIILRKNIIVFNKVEIGGSPVIFDSIIKKLEDTLLKFILY